MRTFILIHIKPWLCGPSEPVCRWCYGRPFEDLETCSQVACMTHWPAVRALDGLVW
jgi:hypothetical protein